jgi:hypothetical protein
VVPVCVERGGPAWSVAAGPFALRFTVGGRDALGWVLRAVPPSLAGSCPGYG